MKYAPSALMGQLSGSQGSTVASRNRYGSYLRGRSTPVNPNTTPQQLVRARLGSLSQQWRQLTQSQRDGWEAYGLQVNRQDSLGVTYTLNGQTAFQSVNLNRLAVGNAIITSAPPGIDDPPTITALSNTADSSVPEIIITWTVTGGLATNDLIIRATPPVSPGRKFIPRSWYKQLTVLPGNTASGADVAAAYAAVYGTTWTGQLGRVIHIEVVPVSVDGLAGVGVQSFSDIT